MSKFEVDLSPALSGFIRRQVEAGLCDTSGQAIEDAVRRSSENDGAKIEAIKAALAPGVAEADAGIFYDGDIDDIIAEERRRASTRK